MVTTCTSGKGIPLGGRLVTDSVDLLISGGTIVDGTGAHRRPGTVVVEGDRMRSSRQTPNCPPTPPPRSTRQAASSPRASSTQRHGGQLILAEPRHEPKVRRVTTEIVGVDGNGFAPFRRSEDSRRSSISTR